MTFLTFFNILIFINKKKNKMKKALKQKADELTTLKIDKATHARIKTHCVENNYWMHLFVETIINEYLDNQ